MKPRTVPLCLLAPFLAAAPYLSSATDLNVFRHGGTEFLSPLGASSTPSGTRIGAASEAVVASKAHTARSRVDDAAKAHTARSRVSDAERPISQALHKRLHSDPSDWTVQLQVSASFCTMALAAVLAAVTHKPELSNACSLSRESLQDEGELAQIKQAATALPAVLAVSMLALAPGEHSQWSTAQVPLMFMVLGFGIGCQQRPRPRQLLAPLVAAYTLSLGVGFLTTGLGPVEAFWAVVVRLLPIETFSSLPVSGTALATSSFGAAIACVALSGAVAGLCRGAGWSGIAYLWLLTLVGFCSADLRLGAAQGTPSEVIMASIPVRLQLPSFAAGMIVSSWAPPRPGIRVLGIALTAAYAASSRLQLSGALLQAGFRGVVLPAHAFMLWSTVDLLILPLPGPIAHVAAMLPSPSDAVLSVSFASFFVLPIFAGQGADAPHGRVVLASLCADEEERRLADEEERRLAAAEGDTVEQVHLGFNASGDVIVTYLTWEKGLPSKVWWGLPGQEPNEADGEVSTYATYICPSNPCLLTPRMGETGLDVAKLAEIVNTSAFLPATSASYLNIGKINDAWGALSAGCVAYKNPLGYYQSPYIHTVVLRGLEPRTRYTYRPEGSSREFNFTTPAASGDSDPDRPFRLGVLADVGITNVSLTTTQLVKSFDPELVILVGDFSYADGWSQKWDIFGHMSEPLMSSVGTLGVAGNHEVATGRYNAVDFKERYPVPYRASDSETPMYYSFEAGPLHIIGLIGSYAPTGRGSPQQEWLIQDLQKVNRSKTPWVVVQFHTPWYSSNDHHYQEGYAAKQDLEGLFYKYGVDLVFNGHIHSYERSHPVYKDKVDPCGTTHIVIGDAGNYEGPAAPWLDPQPGWSAFRESSFGAGLLTVHNATHADWEWRRVACGKHAFTHGQPKLHSYLMDFSANCSTDGDDSAQREIPVDKVSIVRPIDRCLNHVDHRLAREATSRSHLPLLIGIAVALVAIGALSWFARGYLCGKQDGAECLGSEDGNSDASEASE